MSPDRETNLSEKPPAAGEPVDPNIQIKFTIIFGLLALIPFVLFYFYGLESRTDRNESGAITNGMPQVRFAEVTEKAGIHFSRENGATGEKLLPETMGGGCAFFDFNNDGAQDLVFINSRKWPETPAQGPTHALYKNDGRGNYSDVTAGSGLDFSSYGMGVAAGDFDNDGYADLFITGVGGNRLLRNLGGAKFSDVTQTAGVGGSTNNWSTSAAFFDYDHAGSPAHFRECPVVIVVEDKILDGVVRHHEVDPAIVIQINGRYSE